MTPTHLAEIEAHFNGRIPKTLPVRLALEACKIARSLESDLAKANTKIGEQEACYDQHERLESDNARLTRELAETHLRYADIRLGLEKERDAARDELDESRKRLGEAIAIRTRQYKEARAVLEVEQRAGAILAKDAEEARAEAEALRAALQRIADVWPNPKNDGLRGVILMAKEALTAGAAKAATISPGLGGSDLNQRRDTKSESAAEPPAKWFVKRPIPVSAVQQPEAFEVKTLEGTMYGGKGDWLITGFKGEQWPIKDEIFRATYEPAPPKPSPQEHEHGKDGCLYPASCRKPEPRAEELVCPDYKHTWEQCPIRKHGFGLWPASQGGK